MVGVGLVAQAVGADGMQLAAFLLQHVERVAVAHGVVEGRRAQYLHRARVGSGIGDVLPQVGQHGRSVVGREEHVGTLAHAQQAQLRRLGEVQLVVQRLRPAELVGLLLVHVHLHRIFSVGAARHGIDAQLHRLREVNGVGVRIDHQRVQRAVLRAQVEDSRARVLRRQRARHAVQVRSHGQRVGIVDQSALLVDGERIFRSRHVDDVRAVLALRAGGVHGARQRAQRECRHSRVVVGDDFRVVVLQAGTHAAEQQKPHSECNEFVFPHIYMSFLFVTACKFKQKNPKILLFHT